MILLSLHLAPLETQKCILLFDIDDGMIIIGDDSCDSAHLKV